MREVVGTQRWSVPMDAVGAFTPRWGPAGYQIVDCHDHLRHFGDSRSVTLV
jgi:hypothetical protein